MTMADVLSVTPVGPSVRLYVRPYVRHTQRRPRSKSNSFDQNFIKHGHIL